MDILAVIENVTAADVDDAVVVLDKELAGLQTDIVQFCVDGDVESAWESLAQYDRVTGLKEFVSSLKTTESVMED